MSPHVKPAIKAGTALPLLLNERDAATLTGVSLSYLRKSRSEGNPGGRTPGPLFVRVNGRVYYRRADLELWNNELEAQRTV